MKYTGFQIQFSRNLSFREMCGGDIDMSASRIIRWVEAHALDGEHSDAKNG